MRYLMLAISILLGFDLNAQVNFTVFPPAKVVTIDDLLFFNFESNEPTPSKYYVTLELTNEKELVLQQKTAEFSLAVGSVNSTNLYQLKPIQTITISPAFLKAYNANGQSLPIGKYTVSMKLFSNSKSLAENVATGSYTIDNTSALNLIQILPEDKAILQTTTPMLQWKLLGETVKEGCAFELLIKVVEKGQTPSQAMINNPIFLKQVVRDEVYLYNLADRLLTQGTEYVWTVNYICGDRTILNSEFWTFKIKDELNKEKKYFDPHTFYRLQENENAGTAIVGDNFLKLKYLNQAADKDGALEYQIYNSKNQVVLTNKEIPFQLKYGENRFILGLCSDSGFYLKPGSYKFVITNDDGKKFFLQFIVKPENPCE